MGSPVRPEGPNIEQVLAEQANAAMQAGADPHAATQRLGLMIQHLRANPDLAQGANYALAHGADPVAVGSRTWDLAKSDTPEHPQYYGGEEAKAGPLHVAMDAFPFVTKVGAGIDALADAARAKVTGRGDFFDTLGKAYNQDYEARAAAIQNYSQQHRKTALASTVAGALLPAVATFGASLPAEGGEALGLGGRMLTGLETGAKVGALQGLSHAHGSVDDYVDKIGEGATFGAVTGGLAPAVTGSLSYAANKAGLPQKAGAVLDAVASQMDPNSRVGRAVQTASRVIGPKGAAAAAIAQRAGNDEAAGFVPHDIPDGVPMMALDRAGPEVTGLAENIAKRPGRGRAIFSTALTDRVGQMRDNVTQAFDQGTGTTVESGDALLARLADEERQVAQGAAAAKAAGAVKPYQATPVDAWRTLVLSPGKGIAALRAYVQSRGDEARQLYGAARAATQGQPMESPTLTSILGTDLGQSAYRWAKAQIEGRLGSLPTVTESRVNPETLGKLMEYPGINPEKAAEAATEEVTREVPDPQTLHLMKRFLADKARLGNPNDPTGKIAAQAQTALSQWGKIKAELPEAWQQADAAFADKSRVIDALNLGRDLMRTQLNPSGMKALRTSMDAVEQQVAQMPPAEQQAFRIGAQSAITDHIRSGNVSNKSWIAQLADPNSALSRRVVLATGERSAPTQLAGYLSPQTYAAPVPPSLSSSAQATKKGLDVLHYGASAPNAEQTLPVLARDVAAMNPADRAAFQQGAAQALRGEFSGAAVKSPGRVFGASPERVQQTSMAFPSPGTADAFQQRVAAWNRIQEQYQRMTGGSPTFPLSAEEQARQQAASGFVRNLLRLNFGDAGRSLLNAGGKAAGSANRQAMDAEIARILTSPDASAIERALAIAAQRRALSAGASRFLPIVAGSEAGASTRP